MKAKNFKKFDSRPFILFIIVILQDEVIYEIQIIYNDNTLCGFNVPGHCPGRE